ncbi:MAG TPA: sigma factor, partial [Terriglobia bacterium]|nr:sigma factor [Terriglobia bacterium]
MIVTAGVTQQSRRSRLSQTGCLVRLEDWRASQDCRLLIRRRSCSVKSSGTVMEFSSDTFEQLRPLLFSIAYRMLGSASEAEDVVQDAWLRARQDANGDVRSPRAYLTTIVTRLCIDHLRSAERTRMEYPGQ